MSKKISIEETNNVKVFIDELDGVQYLNFETHDAGYSVSLPQLYKYLHMAKEVQQYQEHVEDNIDHRPFLEVYR
jgi:hypothetical protein